jgi:hypothetical protein
MYGNTIYVRVDPASAANIITKYIIEGSLSGELKDDYTIRNKDGSICRILVFEKYYYRVSNRLLLTVIIDNAEGRTRVHYISGGGGKGAIFSFDWGSSESFENCVYDALQEYIV